MKIIIVGTAYPMRGGIAQFLALLFQYLSRNNEVKFYSFKRQYPEILFPGKTQFEEEEPELKVPDEKNYISVDSINPFNWIKVGFKIAKEKPDLLIYKYWIPFFAPCYTTISFIAKKFSKTKVLFICDNVIPHEKRIGDQFLTKLAFSQVDFFVVMSKIVENDLKKFNLKNKSYKLIPHPVYNIFGEFVIKSSAKDFLRRNYEINIENENVILFFGYIRKYKGLDYLIQALPEILKKKKLKLLIVGEFYEDEDSTCELIKSLNLQKNVFLISDYIPNEKVRYFFCASDVVVLPYISATQSGIVQIAYYYNKPVIATNVGGLAEVVIDNKTGFIIEPKNQDVLTDSVVRFFEEKKGDEFSENVREEKKKYEWEGFVEELLKLVNKN